MNEHFKSMIRTLTKGDTRLAESFFRQPGGRKYLEHLTLILIHTLPQHYGEKEALYHGFVEVLDGMELRLRRQDEGGEILENAFRED